MGLSSPSVILVLADWYILAGANLSPTNFRRLMFSQPKDQAGYVYPENGFLQAFGVVKRDGIRQPKHLDIPGEEALLVVKNNIVTGTTAGLPTSSVLMHLHGTPPIFQEHKGARKMVLYREGNEDTATAGAQPQRGPVFVLPQSPAVTQTKAS